MMHVHLLTILLKIGFRLNTSFCVCHMMSPGTRKTFYFDLSGVSWLQNSARKEMPLHSGIFLLILTKIAYALSLNCCVEIVVNKTSLTITIS